MLSTYMYKGAALTHIGIGELAEEIEMLPEGLILGLIADVVLVVAFGNPLIRTAPIVK